MRLVRLMKLLGWPLWLNTAQRPVQLLNFALVGQFLALGQLDQFQHFVQLIVQFLEGVRNEGGVFDGLRNGRGGGGPKVRGLDPFALARRRQRLALRGTLFAVAALLARRLSSTRRHGFRLGRGRSFRHCLGVGRINGIRRVRGKFRGRVRMRLAKAAGGIGFVPGMFLRLGRFGSDRVWLQRLGSR